MSIRAYRLNKIEYEVMPTFNLTHNEKLVDFLDLFGQLSCDTGFVDISVDKVRDALENYNDLELDPYIISNFEKDLLWAQTNKEDYITYYVF